MEEISVLNREARRRGTSYGKLVALLTPEERARLVRQAERAKIGKKKKRGGG